MHVEVITSHEELITIGGDRASRGDHKPEGEALSELVGVVAVQLVMVMILNI